MARRTKQEAEETRSNILNAALDIIYGKGYARSTFVDVAKKINLTKGAVYWHFKSKPDLFIALGRHMEEKIETALHDLTDHTYTLADLKRMLLEMIRLIISDEKLHKYHAIVFYRMEWTDELLSVREFFDRQDREMMEFVVYLLSVAQNQKEIPPEVDVASAARALLAMVDGLLGFCLSRPGGNFEELSKPVETGLNLFFSGLSCTDPLNIEARQR